MFDKNNEVVTTEKKIEKEILYNKDILEKKFELMN